MAIFRSVVQGPGPAGDYWSSTLHSTSETTIGTVHSAFSALITSFVGGTLAAMWPTVTEVSAITTTQIDPTSGRNITQESSGLPIPGTGTGAALPQRVAVVVGMRTTLPTRAGRGRMYFPAPDITHLDDDGLLETTDAQSLATAMASALAVANTTVSWGLFHRGEGNMTPITSVTVGQVLGTQRRRTNKVPDVYSSADV